MSHGEAPTPASPAQTTWSSAAPVFVVVALSLGCSGSSEPTEAPPPQAPARVETLSARDAVAATDARRAGPLLPFVRSADVTSRRRALWSLARIHDDEAVAGLIVGLRDGDPEARRASAFGLGALEREAPSAAVDALVGALAVEPLADASAASPEAPAEIVSGVRPLMLWSLARTGAASAVPALLDGLDGDTESRVAVCRGLAYGPATGWPEPLLREALAGTADSSPRVREACWQGLGRVALPPALRSDVAVAAAAALGSRAEEREGAPVSQSIEGSLVIEARVQAARVLGRVPPGDTSRRALVAAAADPDAHVAIASLRALGSISTGHEGALAEALDAVLSQWCPGAAPASGRPVHVLLTAIEAALPHARAAGIFERASAWLERFEAAPPSRDLAWLSCRAAQWVDAGRGWPARVERCGLEVLGDDDRRVLAAEVLGLEREAEPQRVAALERLARNGGPRARAAVVRAAAASLSERARLPFLRRGLDDEDEGVVLTALEALAAWTTALAHERALGAVTHGSRAEPSAPMLAALDAPLVGAAQRLLSGTSLEAQITLVHTARALADAERSGPLTELLELLRPLGQHPSHAVRSEARRALEALGDTARPRPVDAVPDPQETEPNTLPARARLTTERGEIEIALHRDHAPVTVARFAELARADFFDGLSFHRVIGGFVAQGGDPRGDGYGGPTFWQRCEDNPLAYERGAVGMALAGRDTGGSQFFITLGPQHHLEGRYTLFGQVVRGMEVVDALQVGDPILDVTLSP